MKPAAFDVVVIGGSAGSLPVLTGLLAVLPPAFSAALVVVVHRPRNVASELAGLLASSAQRPVTEPDDKEPLQPGQLYLCPANYHLLVDEGCFSLDYSEPVHYCRPAIDMTLLSVADAFGARALAILLSGANPDGAAGLCHVVAAGGTGLVQEPTTCAFPTMPQAALSACSNVMALTPSELQTYIQSIA